MVLPRVITAVVMVPIVLLCAWYGSLPFFLFVSGVCLIGVWEYCLIADDGGYPNDLGLAIIGTVAVLLSLFIDGIAIGPLRAAPSPFFVLAVWTLILFVREFFRRDISVSFLRVSTTLAGVVLFAFFIGHLLLIRDLKFAAGEGFRPVGRLFIFFLLIVIWVVDTGAWWVGRSFGRLHLAPVISPKKTWEGAIGGTVMAALAGWIFRQMFLREALGPLESVFYAIIIAVTGQISDLVESLMKRSFGVKDSSSLLPGHGGILDRFDSFIFSAPLFYYLLIGTGRFQ
jgi:phosphatidate cytidylyltransferase